MLYLNGQPLSVTIFPDNTSQVWKLPPSTFESRKQSVLWHFSNEAEIMHLAQLQHLLSTISGCETTLTIKYLPYGRQDKSVQNNATFALQTFLKIINDFNFHKIIVVDPHNFDAVRVNCQFQAIYPTNKVQGIIKQYEIDLLCYPDKGALNKYSKIYNHPYIFGEKVRDQLTGNITSYTLYGDPACKNILIVDDICDGGMTFKLLAKDLLAAGANSVVLFVTHGIFSKGTRTLFESGIQSIFTQDGEVSERTGSLQF